MGSVASASSTSTVNSIDSDTLFDGIFSRSETPKSPYTPWETCPDPSGSLLFGDDTDSRVSVNSLKESPSGNERPETRLYEILLDVEESVPDTPSKKAGRRKTSQASCATSVAEPERPKLQRYPNIDDDAQQQKMFSPRIPGTFESQTTGTDLDGAISACTTAASPTDLSPLHTDETRKILGELINVPTAVALMPYAHQLRALDWQVLENIFREHKKARSDLQHLKQVLQIRASSLEPLVVPKSAATTDHESGILELMPYGKTKERRHINNTIRQCIKSCQKPSKTTKNQDKTEPIERKPGWIYIFESPKSAPGNVKIGKSKEDPQKRKADWQLCGVELVELGDSDRNGFYHYSIVESLIKAELHNQRKKYKCTRCPPARRLPKLFVEHNEWYEVSKGTALHSVCRWRKWIKKSKPFDENGILTPYWRWRVQKLPTFIDNIDWDRWTQPWFFEYVEFQLDEFGHGYYRPLKTHFRRKDKHFVLTGALMILILYIWFGLGVAVLGVLALLIL